MNFQNLLDYCSWKDIDIFDGCTVPEPLSIDLVKDNIMKRCGLLRPVYAEPEVFRDLTKIWFDSNQWNFEHIVKIMQANYSPIENVYESDHWETKHTGTDKRALGGSDTLTHGETHTLSGRDVDTLSGSDVDTLSGSDNTQASGIDTVTNGTSTMHNVFGYNSSNASPSSQDVNSGDTTTQYGKKDTTNYGKIDTMAYGKTDTLAYGKTDTASGSDITGYGKTDDFTHGHIETYNRLRHGNIGVTTNDQLITEEYTMLEKFNPYDWIAAKFERENFLQLY